MSGRPKARNTASTLTAMASHTASPRPSTSYSTTTTAYEYTGTPSTSLLRRPSTARPSSGRRSRATSTVGGESQQIVCAISEGRGISPTVGMAFVNTSTGEAVLSQICDNQFYARTLNKLQVFDPTEILIVSTACPPIARSKMYEVIEENILGARIINVDRRYWSEATGLDYINQLAFVEDIEAIKVAIDGNYFATCCFCAALKYVDLNKGLTFAFHSLRIKYQPSEGSMMIDASTIQSLELIQNLQNSQSKECLFGLMNQTLSPMGGRLLRLNILQPSTQCDVLKQRYQAVKEFSEMEDMFVQTRLALQGFLDAEKLLTNLIIIPQVPDIHYAEQSINNILMLKTFVQSISPVYIALVSARSALLCEIREHCHPNNVIPTLEFIQEVINDDVKYEKTPLELRNQRTYAVKAGVSGLLDVARQTFKEATEDVHQHVTDINQQFEMRTETRYDPKRRYYLRVYDADFDGRPLPDILVNRYRKNGFFECQTLNLMKLNQRIEDSHSEVVQMSDRTIQDLLDKVRGQIPSLFRVSESIALLDMISAFNQLATTHEEYTQPEIAKILTIKSGRHPVKEHFNREKFVPNDVYASSRQRFQVVTGYNMSGKSTYIRSIALLSVMAQVGSFVPAAAATFPIVHQLFARVSVDDSIEANVSTFASEMRETAFILRNIENNSIAIIDELGRGTSTRDGLAIALSISEALVNSGSMVWFATHFRELAQIMDQRPGVVNVHFDMGTGDGERLAVRYQVLSGFVEEKHYGLQLARMVNLPPQLLEVAENVARTIEEGAAAKKSSSKSRAAVKRRKLILLLKDQLELANSSLSERGPLLGWLRTLQEEFVMRMEKIDHDCVEGGS